MSMDSKQASTTNLKTNENDSSDIPTKDLTTNEHTSPDIPSKNQADNELNSKKDLQTKDASSQPSTPRISRSLSHSSSHSKTKQVPKVTTIVLPEERPLSPTTRHRAVKQANSTSKSPQRTRSISPRKTFSYLPPDRLNLRAWKQHRRQLAKQEQDDRIYYENRQKLERLAKIAREPSSYPSIHIEQERLRDRHAAEHQRKVLKGYIPILRENLFIVNRLASIKGVYDVDKMEKDFALHTQILKQDAANRKKARETLASRPFILPKINTKS